MSLLNFTSTPEAILDQARHLFVSEDFASAINILRDSFPNVEEVSEKTIISLLKGDTGIQSTKDGQVEISNEFVDAEYQQLAKEVLDNYNFLIMQNNKVFQVSDTYDFDLNAIHSSNELIQELKNKAGELVDLSRNTYAQSIRNIENEHGSFSHYFTLNRFATFTNNKIYFFSAYDNPLFDEICTFYDTPTAAISAYDSAESF